MSSVRWDLTIELRPDRISHILSCLAYSDQEYRQLLDSPVLRDEIIEEISSLIHKLDDSALVSAMNIIKALLK